MTIQMDTPRSATENIQEAKDKIRSIIEDVESLISALYRVMPLLEREIRGDLSEKTFSEFRNQSDYLRGFSDFLRKLVEYLDMLITTYQCASALVSKDIAVLESAEDVLAEAEAFKQALDSLEALDDDDRATVEDAKTEAESVAESVIEFSIQTPVSESEEAKTGGGFHGGEQEEIFERRRKLADALRKGENITVSPDGDISFPSTANAIATLRDQLTGGSYMVNVDGTVLNPLESEVLSDGFKPVDKACVAGGNIPEWEGIQVPEGKLAGGFGMCRICGTVFNQMTNYCPECGTKNVIEKPVVSLDKVQFSAIAPKTFVKGDYSVIEIIMYEEAFRHVVQEAIINADDPVKETKSGIMAAERDARITVMLSSPDIDIEDNTEIQTWKGGYLNFSFAVETPEQYKKKKILFVASVYINDIIATRLKFVAKCKTLVEQKIEVTREDVLSAFISYASQDRNRVAMIIQGMKKARPDMDIFFDVDSLRSGDDWEKALYREIDQRDVLYLCWSHYAKESKWVDAEWRFALDRKGVDCIEPIPIEPPSLCPPPHELQKKHFNDKLLYIINSDRNFDQILENITNRF